MKGNYSSNFINKFPVIFFVCSLFMSFGYAAINSVFFDFSGDAFAKEVSGIFITNVDYKSNINADITNSKVLSAYQTNLNSRVILSDADQNSSITYEITVYNSYNKDYMFDKVEFILGEDTYDNENIIFELGGLNVGDVLSADSSKTFTITFKYNSTIDDNILNSILNFKFILKPYVVATYDYTGTCEKFVTPENGIYKVELWGASGGYSRCNGVNNCGVFGLGAYTSGDIQLLKDFELYVCVGGKGANAAAYTDSKGGFNGGGDGRSDESEGEYEQGGDESSGGGGGATDIRLVNSSNVSSFDGLKSRIMVAAGGAGATWRNTLTFHSGGGLETDIYNRTFIYGGGKDGSDVTVISKTPNTTQTFGYKFGIGAKGLGMGYSDGAPGAGGGYYGGNEYHDANDIYNNLSAGGSSFISGHNGCNAITESSTENNIVHTNQPNHYSNYIFKNTVMIDGEGYHWTTTKASSSQGMPKKNSDSTMTGNSGNGYARITYISEN